ncbi:hypothetical protein CFIO01_13144 [Colletotrichum fioriniae PJ7]|uniref:Ecp2 effector protein-like domain-containing protein n=1 Tax=Colletotrichum fioriniae PJ7 TaxID=1445577 RepID=A0A010R816_9PEZI|nr:hypothetical protein CFIO01_13144 [Colletotrichum fioriniae PJ7]
MVVMVRLLATATAVMALAVAANPVAQGPGIIRDPACGSLCAFTEPPCPKAVCHEVLLGNGKCKAIFTVPKIDKADSTEVERVVSSVVEVKQTKKSFDDIAKGNINTEDTLLARDTFTPIINYFSTSSFSKRHIFEKSDKSEKVCKGQGVTCYNRNQKALTKDCMEIYKHMGKTDGTWTFSDLDLRGTKWVEFMRIGTCLVAVGSEFANVQGSPINGKSSKIGNLDMFGIFAQSFDHCGKDGNMEVRGSIGCKEFPLSFWIVATDKYDCCKSDPPLKHD